MEERELKKKSEKRQAFLNQDLSDRSYGDMSRRKNRARNYLKRSANFLPSETMFISLQQKANALGFIDAPMLHKDVKEWRAFRADIVRRFLSPDGG